MPEAFTPSAFFALVTSSDIDLLIPSTFAPSAHKHKWVDITDRITKVSQLTNDAGYLTAHQSLASYYTKAEIDAKGYTTNKGTVTSVALTLPTG